MTEYVVLRREEATIKVAGVDPPPFTPAEDRDAEITAWVEAGRSSSARPIADVMSKLDEAGADPSGEYVAVPARSWRPARYERLEPRYGKAR